ncbi:MAG: nuclease, partial [Halalkalicoccus sp.]|nr:nuclease [Halalkalicoccus sp.]
MDRRTFLATAGVALGLSSGVTSATPPADRPPLRLYSPASQLAADATPLADESVVAAWAEPTASNRDASRGDPVRYEGRIPLVSIDGSVAGIGSMLVADPVRQGGHATYADSNARALLSLWDSLVEGRRVRWDASHDQYWTLDAFGHFRSRAEREGYEIDSIDVIADGSLADVAGLVITTPPRTFDPEELDALAAFV